MCEAVIAYGNQRAEEKRLDTLDVVNRYRKNFHINYQFCFENDILK